jgi:hypothetical protein
MPSAISRFLVVAAATGALVAAGLPAAVGASSSRTSAETTLADHCLIGTWRDGGGPGSTQFRHHTVPTTFGGGDVDHIRANGVDHDSWAHAKPFIGTYRGHRLKETIRGHNVLALHALSGNRLRDTEKGWKKGRTNRYVYRSKHIKGFLFQTGSTVSHYRCSATTLTFLTKHGKVVSKETRISRKP